MRIGDSNTYNYINISKQKNPVSNTEKSNPIPPKNQSIDEYQSKAMKEVEDFKKQLKKYDEKLTKTRDTTKIQLQCIAISRRIISGHKVPKSDYMYLAKHDPELYQKSIILRIEREKPLKFDRISEYKKMNNLDIEKFYMKNKDSEIL